MKIQKEGNIYVSWTLRILLMMMIVLFALFSMDVFEEGKGFWDTTVDFLMHNIPSFVMIIILIIAWKREDIGGALLMTCVASLVIFLFIRNRNISLVMLGIPFLIGALFVVNYYFIQKKTNEETLSNKQSGKG